MLRIRLTRIGKKNSPAYRVVVADKRRAVKRKFIEIIGNYNPTLKPKEIVIDKERADFWMKLGAQPSDTVNNLMCDLGILDKKDKINKIYGKKLSKKAIKEGGEKKETLATETASEEAAATLEPEKVEEAPANEAATDSVSAETVDEPKEDAEVVIEEKPVEPEAEKKTEEKVDK